MLIKNLLEPKKPFFWIATIWTIIFTFMFLQGASSLPKVNINQIDKLFHAVFHCIFTSIWFLSFRIRNIDNLKKAFFFSIFYGILIEILQQLLTSTRKSDLLDILANIVGAIFAFFVIRYFLINSKNIKSIKRT